MVEDTADSFLCRDGFCIYLSGDNMCLGMGSGLACAFALHKISAALVHKTCVHGYGVDCLYRHPRLSTKEL